MNLTKRACCQLVFILNNTEKIPPCTPSMFPPTSSSKPPVYLMEPVAEKEDHLTFFLGIFALMLIAIGCSLALSKITKPKVSIGYNTSTSSYDILMWLSSNQPNRSSMLLMLRSIACRVPMTPESSNVSVVSSNVPLLPSYQRATTTSPSTNQPPPPYSALIT
ncbi:unnamed protein product [Caenorhabditis angaria]|uniref:Uncharacterized protein n=1 Tax=Caenorhabditis angaria TaxID=860376 RepID=A0A9P1IQZ7_9PELO|nr:unnamed protein product [Caenorhabditis angaria]